MRSVKLGTLILPKRWISSSNRITCKICRIMKIAMRYLLSILAAALLCASCCLLRGQKSGLADTQWTSSYEMFVADAGTETTTVTLTLGRKDFVLDWESHLPAHPATFVNADGTIDTIPATSRQRTQNGTYKVKSNTLILTDEFGAVHRLDIVSGQLKSNDLTFQELVFTRVIGR